MISYSKHPEVALALAGATKVANAPPPSLFHDVVRHPAFLAPLAMMGVSAAVGGAQSFITKLLDAKKKNETFQGMLRLNPTLRGQDQTTVKRVFNSLHSANPHFMGDPMVAGALVHNTIEAQGSYGMDQPMVALAKQVSELSQGRASITSALEKERKMRSSWGEKAEKAVEGGFKAVEAIQKSQEEAPFKDLAHERFTFGREKAKFEAGQEKERHEKSVADMRDAIDRLREEGRQARESRDRAMGHRDTVMAHLQGLSARTPGAAGVPMQQTGFNFGPHVHHRVRSATPVSSGGAATPIQDAAQVLIDAVGLNRTQGP